VTSKLYRLESFKTHVEGHAEEWVAHEWPLTRRLLADGYIVGAVRDNEGTWCSLGEYRQYFHPGNAGYTYTFHGLITRRGIEALYKNRRITFSEGIDVWDARERARVRWADDHADEFLVVKYSDDSVGDKPYQKAPARRAAEVA